MKNIKMIAISIAIPLVFGLIGTLIGNPSNFSEIVKPSFAPPGFLFPIVWTILYILMGVSSYMIYKDNNYSINAALIIYLIQLVVNMLWTFFFFNLKWYLFSFIWIILLIVLVIVMIYKFIKINKVAGYIQIPYLIWITFASVLNFSIYLLN